MNFYEAEARRRVPDSTMTHEALRDIYDRLKERPANADLPAFAAVKAAKAEGRIGIAQEFKMGILVSTWITITTGKDTGTWAWRLWDDTDERKRQGRGDASLVTS